MKFYLFALIAVLYSCSGKYSNPKNVEFRHIDESYEKGRYKYSYSNHPLDSIEIEQLSIILEKRGLKYELKSGKLYYERPKYIDIQNEFDIDRELVDSIINKEVSKSPFIKELLKKMSQ